MPLKIHGIVSYLPARTPNDEEIRSTNVILELTPQSSTWDPHDNVYQIQEDSMLTFTGDIREPNQRKFIVSSVISRALEPITFAEDASIRTNEMGFCNQKVYALKTANGLTSQIRPNELASIWNIGLETARRTLKVTTRLCPKNVEDITLNRRYSVNDRMIRYKHLNTPIFMDTMFASKRAGK